MLLFLHRWFQLLQTLIILFNINHLLAHRSGYCCILITTQRRWKTSKGFFIKIYTSHFICNVCIWQDVGDRTELQYIDPHSYGRQRCVFLVLQGCSTGGPEAHSAGWWLSLLHLISKFSGPQLITAPRAPSVWRGFFYHILSATYLQTVSNSNCSLWLLSWLSHIIVQRPLNRPLNLWNGMFDRHQAEITVMQFIGHSLPVHHSEVGPSPCPILSAELTCTISFHNCHWNVSLPSSASLWMAFLAGSKVKIQHYNRVI